MSREAASSVGVGRLAETTSPTPSAPSGAPRVEQLACRLAAGRESLARRGRQWEVRLRSWSDSRTLPSQT